MNVAFLELDETGVYVVGSGYASVPPEGAITLPSGWRPEPFANHYLVDGELTPRPVAPSPSPLEGGGYRLDGCPAGSLVIVSDLVSGESMAELVVADGDPPIDFDLPDAGKYLVEVAPPLPYLASKATIEVP